MLLALTWNGIPIPNLPTGLRLWVGGFVVLAGVISWAWKNRSAAGDLLTKIRTSIAPKATAQAGTSRQAGYEAIATLAEIGQEKHSAEIADAAVKAFEAFTKVEPGVTP